MVTILISPYLDVRRLLKGTRLLEGGAYFNADTHRCGTYYRSALIRGDTVILRLKPEI